MKYLVLTLFVFVTACGALTSVEDCTAQGKIMKAQGSGQFSGATFMTCVNKDDFPRNS